jgi:hypothetical protein
VEWPYSWTFHDHDMNVGVRSLVLGCWLLVVGGARLVVRRRLEAYFWRETLKTQRPLIIISQYKYQITTIYNGRSTIIVSRHLYMHHGIRPPASCASAHQPPTPPTSTIIQPIRRLRWPTPEWRHMMASQQQSPNRTRDNQS